MQALAPPPRCIKAVSLTLTAPAVPPQLLLPPCSRPDPPRSILGLPVFSCRSQQYALWVLLVLVLDLTYSAFLLPLSIGFEVRCWVQGRVGRPCQGCTRAAFVLALPAHTPMDQDACPPLFMALQLQSRAEPSPALLNPIAPADPTLQCPQVSDLRVTSWACWVDLAAGLVFATELFLGFHISYLASHNGHQREIKGGRAVAWYYVRHGSFWQDALSTSIWITQVGGCGPARAQVGV